MTDETPKPPSDRYWVGGGSIAAVCGISPFQTPLQAYLSIIGEAEPFDADTLRFFARRKRVEPFVVELLKVEHGLDIVATNQRYTDAEFPHFKAELDAELADGRTIEVKSVSPFAARGWGSRDGEQDIPLYVLAQAQWGLGVSPKVGDVTRSGALVVPQVGFDETDLLPTQRDDQLIAMLRDKAQQFWTQHVLPRIPPAPTSLEDVKLLFPRSVAKQVMATPEAVVAVGQLAEVKAALKEADEREKALKLLVQQAFGEADTLVGPDGRVLSTWRSTKSSRVFDKTRFAAEHPDLYEKFHTEKPGHRVLLLK